MATLYIQPPITRYTTMTQILRRSQNSSKPITHWFVYETDVLYSLSCTGLKIFYQRTVERANYEKPKNRAKYSGVKLWRFSSYVPRVNFGVDSPKSYEINNVSYSNTFEPSMLRSSKYYALDRIITRIRFVFYDSRILISSITQYWV